MKFNRNLLCEAVRYGLAAGAVGLFGLTAAPAFAQDEDEAAELERIEVTGSRIKRADVEGAVPVTVITREQIQATGKVSVADIMRDVTFSSAGNFRPQSGSSAQALADIDLRGLGSSRTLVLIDGRRAPKAPFVGSNADLNSIPLGAVERIEILTDGASAIYGSDAIGGVVNIILRKDFNGAEYMLGKGNTSIEGGDTEEGSLIFGTSGDRGSMLAGVSYNKRGMVFTRDRPWGSQLGNSTFGNNILNPFFSTGDPGWLSLPTFIPLPGGCTNENFSISPANGRCVYDFNRVAADEAKVGTQSAFARGTYEINENWLAYMTTSVSRVESFGRYAPTPGVVLVAADSPNNPTANMPGNPNPGVSVPFYLYHRFAAGGNRDTTSDSDVYDLNFGFQGRLFDTLDIDVGVRQSEFKYFELGRGYIVTGLAEAAINNGSYNLFDPASTPASVLSGISATINRESTWLTREMYAQGNMDLFEMGGGVAGMAFGAEYRNEEYSDLYDSLSEGNQILGSAGNSAGGSRDVLSLYAEVLFPVMDNFEISLAARYEDYSDYGNDLAPKISFRYQPLDNLTLRAAYGEGFRAPTLDIVTQKRAFSADTVFDPATCLSFADYPSDTGGLTPAQWCEVNGGVNGVQVNAFRNAASTLGSEQSDQYSFGIVYDPTDWLGMTLDYWNIKITDRIKFFSSQELVDIDIGDDPDPFPGLPCSLTRRVDGSISEVNNCYANQGEVKTDGMDFSARTRFDFGDWGMLSNQLNVSYLAGYKVDGGAEQVGLEGLPEYRATLSNVWSYGDFNVVYNLRYIHDNGPIPSQTLNDLQGNWNAPWNGKITLGVTNLEDELPYLGPGASFGSRNFNFALYDGYGRTTYLRYTQSF